MIKVICNSGAIIGLSIIGELNLLWEIFNEVIIPREVYREVVEANPNSNYGAKEREEAMLLQSLGIIGLLIIAKKKNKITEIKKYLDLLIKSSYRISKKLYKNALSKAGELD